MQSNLNTFPDRVGQFSNYSERSIPNCVSNIGTSKKRVGIDARS